MIYLNPKGRDWGNLVNWDSLGKLYAAITIIWTVVLYAGATWLYINRNKPYLKIRNIPLAIAAISFLHVYLVKILLAYTTNGHFLCWAEFWIMSIYLPFGIALSQANMVQLLSVKTRQLRLLQGHRDVQASKNEPWNLKGLRNRWTGMTSLKRTYTLVGAGMVVQLVVTTIIYATNTKLQGHWGNIAETVGQVKCRKGPEWIPSALWQLFFSCLYGPYLLWKVRNVRDTHYWRLQVICCVIAGFPGSPLWLAAVFQGPAFKPVNKWFVPPMWLAPGIIVLQFCTIFFPIYEDLQSRHGPSSPTSLSSSSSSAWEKSSSTDASIDGDRNGLHITSTNTSSAAHTASSSLSKYHPFPTPPTTIASGDMAGKQAKRKPSARDAYSLASMERMLQTNPQPLLQFAATRDFTAENIIFLLAVRGWKLQFASSESSSNSNDKGDGVRKMWSRACEMYTESVDEHTAEFPINIDFNIRANLESVFAAHTERSSSPKLSHANVVSPFAGHNPYIPLSPLPPVKGGSPWPKSGVVVSVREDGGGGGCGEGEGKVPEGFDRTVFDAAERSIKYLVVTNTWRKFVGEEQARGGIGAV